MTFQGFTEIQNGRHRSTLIFLVWLIFWFGQFFCLVNFFLNLNITFLAAWGCASDFLEMLLKFKMAASGQF